MPFTYQWESYQAKGCKATLIYAPTDISFGTFRMLQTVISLRQEVDEDRFIVVRSKDELQEQLELFSKGGLK